MKRIAVILLWAFILGGCTHSTVKNEGPLASDAQNTNLSETEDDLAKEQAFPIPEAPREWDTLSEDVMAVVDPDDDVSNIKAMEQDESTSNRLEDPQDVQEIKETLEAAFMDKNVYYSSSTGSFVYPNKEVTLVVPPGVPYIELGRSAYADLGTFEQYGLGAIKALTDLCVDKSSSAGNSQSNASGNEITFYSLSALGLHLVDFTDANRLSTRIIQGDVIVKVRGHHN